MIFISRFKSICYIGGEKSGELLCFRAPPRGGDSWVEERISKGPVVAEPVDLGVGEEGSL